jgi:hypothetical protein
MPVEFSSNLHRLRAAAAKKKRPSPQRKKSAIKVSSRGMAPDPRAGGRVDVAMQRAAAGQAARNTPFTPLYPLK